MESCSSYNLPFRSESFKESIRAEKYILSPCVAASKDDAVFIDKGYVLYLLSIISTTREYFVCNYIDDPSLTPDKKKGKTRGVNIISGMYSLCVEDEQKLLIWLVCQCVRVGGGTRLMKWNETFQVIPFHPALKVGK